MREPVLVINAGSSSIKFSVFETATDRSLAAGAHGQVEGIGTSARLTVTDARGGKLADQPLMQTDYDGAIAAMQAWFENQFGSESSFNAVGHRIVHGGSDYARPVLIDAAVLAALERLVPLAPLHQPHQIAAIRAIGAAAPGLPQVASFDTAFHRSQPPLAQQYALPRTLSAQGIRRYGFHGLSYEYIVSVLPQFAPACAGGRLVVAHLGNGASMCAIDQGRSVATTMGFTAIEGLPMGTRSGTLDPGILLYLMQHHGMQADDIEQLVYERSGLLGVSGISSDMRVLLASADPHAAEAVDLFVYRIGRELGSLVAALAGIDALVFTGGIGEHSPQIRARVCAQAHWLGVQLDEASNASGGPCISRPGSAPSVWMIPTNENLMVARHARALLDGSGSGR